MPDDVSIVMLGNVTFEQGRLNFGGRWMNDENSPPIKAGMVFDVLGCSGFLAQVRVAGRAGEKLDQQFGWKVEVVPGSVRDDTGAARKRCGDDHLQTVDVQSRALAVYPSRDERRRITISSSDALRAVYNSLPLEARKCHEAAHQAYPEYQLGNFDAWTDADGDGAIDLVVLTVTCDCTPQDDLICQTIFRLSNGRWQQVARLTPA